MKIRKTGAGWLFLPIPINFIQRAQDIRAERNLLYGNIFPERESDWRWVGELGELGFGWWLGQQKFITYEWIHENAAGKLDFILNGSRIGMKTVKRRGV